MPRQKRLKPITVGSGDYRPLGSDTAVYLARCRFLEHVRVERPQALAELRQLLKVPAADQAEHIGTWARDHRLLKDGRAPRWITSTVRSTLRMWSESPATKRWCFPAAADWGVLSDEEMQILISTSWDPFGGETETQAIERLNRDYVIPQMQRIAERAAAVGVASVLKRDPKRLGWLARYLVKTELPSSIAKSVRMVTAASVKEALRELSTLIGLDLPPFPVEGRRGRPKY